MNACRPRYGPDRLSPGEWDIFGVLPLVVVQGAGADMCQYAGHAVFSGMIGVTLFGIFLTPVFFFVLLWLKEWREADITGWECYAAAREALPSRVRKSDSSVALI